MRKLILTTVSLVALVATGVAVAHGIEGAKTAAAVSGTFTATQAKMSSTTCTTSDNKTIVVTSGTYTGTATGSPDLTGAVTVQARSVVNTTDGVGTVAGRLQIGDGTRAALSGVWDHGTVAGLLVGHSKAPAALLGNFSATLDPATGFTNGKIGGGSAGGSAVEISRASCASSSTTKERSDAAGTISAISSSSITVAGLTCATPTDLTSQYKTGDAVRIDCSFASGTNTLAKIRTFAGAKHNARSGDHH